MNPGRDKIELLRGTLDMLILRTLLVGRAEGWLTSKWESRDGKREFK